MKKMIFLCFWLLIQVSCFAQIANYQFGFEAGSTLGAWNYFENGSNTTGLTIVANPSPGGINSSPTVAKFTASKDGGEWSGCESLYGTLGKWKFDGANATEISIDVYKTTFSPVFIKFTSTNSAGQGTTFVGNKIPSAINQWVTLTFIVDFSVALIGTGNGTGGGGINNADNNLGNNQFVIHVDKSVNRPVDNEVYFDNLRFVATKLADPILPPAPVAAPLVHAPTQPTRMGIDVVSIYAGRYTDLPNTKIGKNWGEATIASDILVDGDLTKQLKQFNYQGVVLDAPINLMGFMKIHLDVFKTDQAQIKLSIIHQGGSDITQLISVTQPGWNSFDLPLSSFVGLDLSKVYQIKLEGAPTQGNTTVFFDNLYFYKGTSTRVVEPQGASINIYPNPAKNHFLVDLSAINGKKKTVQVYTAFGKLMDTFHSQDTFLDIYITDWVPGIYFLHVASDEMLSRVYKFEVMK
jgi:Secretion system C-terminal sorting domain